MTPGIIIFYMACFLVGTLTSAQGENLTNLDSLENFENFEEVTLNSNDSELAEEEVTSILDIISVIDQNPDEISIIDQFPDQYCDPGPCLFPKWYDDLFD